MTSGEDSEREGRRLLELIEQNRVAHRRHPDRFLAEISADLWRNMPDDEALDDFRHRLRTAPWWAIDAVECLEAVVRDRPEWAARTFAEASDRWLGASADDDPDMYLDWLAERTRAMRRAVDDEARGSL
ncbi:MAG TPA: hypothetical protein VGP27_07870 [Mycobacterium sp.]|jgi:hypothetical protein|nr:hypothetical protein [Mycobacterium sp.]